MNRIVESKRLIEAAMSDKPLNANPHIRTIEKHTLLRVEQTLAAACSGHCLPVASTVCYELRRSTGRFSCKRTQDPSNFLQANAQSAREHSEKCLQRGAEGQGGAAGEGADTDTGHRVRDGDPVE